MNLKGSNKNFGGHKMKTKKYFRKFARLIKAELAELPYNCELEEICDLIEKCCEYNNPLDWAELAQYLDE